MNSLEFTPGDGEIARDGRAGANHHRIKPGKVLRLQIDADVDTGLKANAFILHQIKAAVQNPFLQFKIRDAVSEKPADPVGAFVNRHIVTDTV